MFGGGTHNAVVAFQQHAGIGADGVVGPTTWKNLIWHYQYLFNGTGFCDQDPDGNGPLGRGDEGVGSEPEPAPGRERPPPV